MAHVQPGPAIRIYRFASSPVWRTHILQVAIWLCVAGAFLLLFTHVSEQQLLASGKVSKEAIAQHVTRLAVATAIFGLVVILEVASLAVWMYGMNRNCHGFGAAGMAYTPGWAAASLFIPVLNLWRPYYVMKEISQVSRNPVSWFGESGSVFVPAWWAMRLLAALLACFAAVMFVWAGNLAEMQSALRARIWVDTMWLIAFLLEFVMVTLIASDQVRLVKKSSELLPVVPVIIQPAPARNGPTQTESPAPPTPPANEKSPDWRRA